MSIDNAKTQIFYDAGSNFLTSGITNNGIVDIDNERIAIPISKEIEPAVIDATGCVVLPGFVDQHIHGVEGNHFWGLDSVEAYVRSVKEAARALPKYGVTSFVPTSVTSGDGNLNLLKAVNAISGISRPHASARILGSHAEGPFLNPQYRGAHVESGLRPITAESTNHLIDAAGESLTIVTLAASLHGSFDAIKALSDRGVIVQIGHDMPSQSEMDSALSSGASGVTHLFNGMGGINHRNNDLAAMTLANPQAMFELIIHGGFVSDAWLRHTLLMAPERAIAISDSVGLLPHETMFNGTNIVAGPQCHVRKTDNSVWAATGTMADSVAVLRNLKIGWSDIAKIVSRNSTDLLSRISQQSYLTAGDAVVWKDGVGVIYTVIDGSLAHVRDRESSS